MANVIYMLNLSNYLRLSLSLERFVWCCKLLQY